MGAFNLTQDKLFKAQYSALSWLKKSYQATNEQGFAAFYGKKPLLKGRWAAAYPETSGYIIPTLLAYSNAIKWPELEKMATDTANWLCQIQLPSGGFNSGFVGEQKPSIFNSGQILIGLLATYERFLDSNVKHTIRSTVSWLLEHLEEDGSWQKFSYVEHFSPTYYARVIWPLAKAGLLLEDANIIVAAQKAFDYYFAKLRPNKAFSDWGFEKGKAALTHTIGYTLRGFLESGILWNDEKIIKVVIESCRIIQSHIDKNGKIAGTYDSDWNGNYSFQCLTGNCQLAIIFLKLFQMTGEESFKTSAIQILQPVFATQYTGKDESRFGGIPGSRPVYGPYLRFRYPNWACKFFLDATLLLAKVEGIKLNT